MSNVEIDKYARRQILKLPYYIVFKFQFRVNLVKDHGIGYARQIPGFHDEPLLGRRLGQRSVRLNKAYRAIYIYSENYSDLEITVIEVSKHDY